MNREYLITLEANLAESQQKQRDNAAEIKRLSGLIATTYQDVHSKRVRRSHGKSRLAGIQAEIERLREDTKRLDLSIQTTERTIALVRQHLGLDDPEGVPDAQQ